MRSYERIGNGWSSNRYYAMRHGTSRAMEQGVIVSSLEAGTDPEYGLTQTGREEVIASVERSGLSSDTLILSSPLSRAFESAMLAEEKLGARAVRCALELCERDFGEFEGKSTENYDSVWARDRFDGATRYMGVEPADEVALRGLTLIHRLDKEYVDTNILLVSHGDTLQILEAVRRGQLAGNHRALFPLGPGEIRRL